MKSCEVCGNEYEKMLEIKIKNDDSSYWFDCFECASFKLAPECMHCRVKIIGHGHETEDLFFCCAHCARAFGHDEFVDHAKHRTLGPVLTALDPLESIAL